MTAPTRLLVRAIGVTTRLDVEDPVVASRLADLLAGLGVERAALDGPADVVVPASRGGERGRAAALTRALAEVNVRTVTRTPFLCGHSAVVARPNGALVVLGASGQGKSTVTAALVSRGWRYLSDEALVLPWDGGDAVPYARPLALSRWSALATGTDGGVLGDDETYHLPETRHDEPARVRDVVLLDRPAGAPAMVQEHRAVALEQLVRRAFTLHRDPGSALLRYASLLRESRVWRLVPGPPLDTADLLGHACAG